MFLLTILTFIYLQIPQEIVRDEVCYTGVVENHKKSFGTDYYACADEYDKWVEVWKKGKIKTIIFRDEEGMKYYLRKWGIHFE